MKFGLVPTVQAVGCILAHSLRGGVHRFAKGTRLDTQAVQQLVALNVTEVVVASLGSDDLDENTAAAQLALGLASDCIEVTPAFAGRVNLIAKVAGVICVNAKQVNALNNVNEAITLATLSNFARVAAGTLLATFKIIPYAVEKNDVNFAFECLSNDVIRLHPFKSGTANLILTRTIGFKPSLLEKGTQAVEARLSALGWRLGNVEIVNHETAAVSQVLQNSNADMTLVLAASATSDRMDVAPAAVLEAGGKITRFGMPVDPGNLLFLGEVSGKPVIGLPGCVRAPALNGTDWVLERLAAGLPVTDSDIATMGVGGLLKEIPQRTQPRRATKQARAGKVEVILLAAGKSSRMGASHKLLRKIDGIPLLRRTALTLLGSRAAKLHVVLPPKATALRATLQGVRVNTVIAAQADKGLASSLKAGINVLSDDCAAVIVALADMPDVTASHLDQLIAAYAPQNEHYIVAPIAPNGKRGNPVLFDRRYFEALANLQGDRGAKSLIDQAGEFVIGVPMDTGVLVDLDTPEAWAEWGKTRA